MRKTLLTLTLIVISAGFISGQNSLQNIIKEKLNVYNSILPNEKVYIQCDRPFYKPGDDIWMALWITDGITNKSSAVSEIVNVELIDPRGTVVEAHRVLVDGGRATCDFTIDSSAMGGIFKIKAYTSWMQNFSDDNFFVKELQVQDVSLPAIRMKLDFERKAYGPGDTVRAKLLLQDNDNTPLEDFSFTYSVSINGETYVDSHLLTDKTGRALISFILPLSSAINDGLLTVRAEVRGDILSISRSVPVILDNIDLMFFPEGGDLVAGVVNNCAFKALNEYGKPADIEGVVFDSRHKEVAHFRSYHYGMGSFHFLPQPGERYYALIDRPEGIMKLFPLPKAAENGFLLELPSPLLFTRCGSAGKAPVRIVSPQNTTVTLVAQVQGQIFYSAEVSVVKGENTVDIPLSSFPCGVAQITLFTANNVETCERLVFVNKDKQLKAKITTDKDAYQPREKVKLQITTTDIKGGHVAAHMALAVVDDKLISLADDKSDNILSYLLLSSELKGKIEEPRFYFDNTESKADTALDYLLLTQGWRRFTWEEVVETSSYDLAKTISHQPEKRILCGTVTSRSRSEIQRTRLYIKDTGLTVTPDRNGYYEFRDLDLTRPVTLVAVSGNNDTITRAINDYSSAETYKNIYYQSSGGNGISGVVREKGTGEPIPGATIIVKGTNTGTITDVDGRFFIKTRAKDILYVSFIGYRSVDLPAGKDNDRVIELERDYIQLDEAMVVTYALQIRRSVVSSAVAVQHTRNPVHLDVEQDNTTRQKENRPLVAAAEVKNTAEKNTISTAGDQIIYLDDFVEEVVEEEDPVFCVVEEMPHFPGGELQVTKWITSVLRYPDIARENYIQGRVIVRFIINREGRVVDPVIIRGVDPTLDNEALRVIRIMPRWTPGRQMGRPVDAYYIIPVTFRIDDSETYSSPVNAYREEPKKPHYYRARQFYSPVYEQSEEVMMRNDFRRTIYWNPLVHTDNNGSASIEFYCSDAITTFRATAEGIGLSGMAGRTEATFFSTRPVSVDALIPGRVSFSDTIFIPVTVSNKTSEPLSGELTVDYPSFLQPLGENPTEIIIPANNGITCLAGFVVLNQSDTGNIKITLRAGSFSDVISSSLISAPYGYQRKSSFTATDLNNRFEVTINDAMPGSVKAEVKIYPGLQASMTSSLESMLSEPHGCFEQTAATAYPDILVLKYLKDTGRTDKNLEKKALSYITGGYKLLASYETPTGGFEWFGKSPGHEGLTAFGLMLFNDMRSVTDIVDDDMYTRTLSWLLGRKDFKGGFNLEKGKYGFGNNAGILNNAYIVYALSETGNRDIYREFEKSYLDNINRGDAYCLALLANTSLNLGETDKAQSLINLLRMQAEENGVAALKAETSITGSRGRSLSVETAALLATALMKQERKDEVLLRSCMHFILSSRQNSSFGSTQANILALKALTAFTALYPDLLASGKAEVKVNDKTLGIESYNPQQSAPVLVDNLHTRMKEGGNNIDIIFTETVIPADFWLNVGYYSSKPLIEYSAPVSITTELKQTSVRRGESIRLTCTIKNEEERGQSMTVASVALPAGFAFQPWQLKEMQEKNLFDFYEINENTLYIYYRTLEPDAEYIINLDVKAMIPGVYHSFSSECYLYYMPEAKSYGTPVILEVLKD